MVKCYKCRKKEAVYQFERIEKDIVYKIKKDGLEEFTEINHGIPDGCEIDKLCRKCAIEQYGDFEGDDE